MDDGSAASSCAVDFPFFVSARLMLESLRSLYPIYDISICRMLDDTPVAQK